MATGSRRAFQYTSDNGDLYGVRLDESTYENLGLGFGQAVDPGDPDYRGLLRATGSQPLAMRYFNMAGTDADGRTVTRRIYVGDPDSAAWQDPETFQITMLTVVNNTATPTVFSVTSAIGERRSFLPAQDTGLIDGDTEDTQVAGPAPE